MEIQISKQLYACKTNCGHPCHSITITSGAPEVTDCPGDGSETMSSLSLDAKSKTLVQHEPTKDLLTKVIVPYATKVKQKLGLPNTKKAIIIWDTFKGRNNNDIGSLLKDLNLA